MPPSFLASTRRFRLFTPLTKSGEKESLGGEGAAKALLGGQSVDQSPMLSDANTSRVPPPASNNSESLGDWRLITTPRRLRAS